MKKKIGVLILLLLVAPICQAQVAEILFAVFSGLINAEHQRKQNREIVSIGVLCNLYLVEGDNLQQIPYWWDPSTGPVIITRQIVLEPILISSGRPSSKFRMMINNRWVYESIVDHGKFSRGQVQPGGGVIGGWPKIRAADLNYGINEIKFNTDSKFEWTTMVVIFIPELGELLRGFEESKIQEALHGFSGRTTPVLESYVARDSEGKIRTFLSLDELKMALETKSDSASPPTQLQPTHHFEIRAVVYDRDKFVGQSKAKAYEALAKKAAEMAPFTGEVGEIILRTGQGVALLITAPNRFKAQIIGQNQLVWEGNSSAIEGQPIHFLFLPVTFAGTTENEGKLIVSGADGSVVLNLKEVR